MRGRIKDFRWSPWTLLLAALGTAILPAIAHGQGVAWSKRWGRTGFYDAGWGSGLYGGNLYVGGYTAGYGAGNRDFVLLQYDATGAVQWAKTWGGATNEYGYDLSVSSSGNCVMSGRSNSWTATYDATVAKLDSTGTLQWAKTWGTAGDNEYATGVAQDGSGNVYVTGMFFSGGTIFTLKYDSSGTLQWAKRFGAGLEWGWMLYSPDIAVDGSGNSYVTAGTFTYGSNPGVAEDVIVLKYDTSGTLQWAKSWGQSTVHEEGQAIAVSGSSVYVAGVRNSATYNYSSSGSDNAFLLKLDSSGTLVWATQIDTGTLDYYDALDIDSSGNIYASGRYLNDVLVSKFNGSGVHQWSRSFGGSGLDIGYGGAVSGLNYYVVGYDSSTNTATIGTLSPTVTDQSAITTASVVGAEATPVGTESSQTGSQTSPTGSETGDTPNPNVLILNMQENGPPCTPTGASPVEGSRDVSETPTLIGDTFCDPNGDLMTNSEWRVTTDILGLAVVYDATTGTGTTQHTVATPLNGQTSYYWSCRYEDDHNNWSEWSPGILFTTGGVNTGSFTISGKIRHSQGDRPTIYLTGTMTGTFHALRNGTFSIPNLPAGVYLVTPDTPGHWFAPENRSVTITDANVGNVNFKQR